MFNKYIAYPKKILSTPESDAMVARLRKINNYIRDARTSKLHEWVHSILSCDSDTLPNIFLHIHTILIAFINKKLYVNSDEYFYLMKCGNYILNKEHITNNPKYEQYKYMVALYFLNYIKKLTTYDFKNKYDCNINEYIKTCYTNIFVDSCLQVNTIGCKNILQAGWAPTSIFPNATAKDSVEHTSLLCKESYDNQSLVGTNIEMRHIYMNLKKIVYVKKYPHAINSKVFSIMLEYWQDSNYIITEIPASYITKDALLTDTELTMLDVTQQEMDLLFGAYTPNTNNVVIQEDDESYVNDISITVEPELGDLPTNTAQNDAGDSQDEAEEGIYPDEYE